MLDRSLAELVPLLQVSIGPVIVISGVGLLLLSMTNRLARVIDRSRQLAKEESAVDGAARESLHRQVEILYRRSRLVRRAIFLASVSVFLVAVLIIALFLAELLRLRITPVLVMLFVASMVALILSLVDFIRDIHLSLVALDLELGRDRSASRG